MFSKKSKNEKKRFFHKLSKEEIEILRTKNSSTNYSAKSRSLPYAFTEKGLYMLATILKSQTS
ncbi:ORF6N domain-containing protein [Candidatus Saccharibacteria bacterium]|nr:ORF6N domain-containing protein [Candidatus Saccharibacteria bacterium]